MVNIDQKEFNDDMTRYLEKVKKRSSDSFSDKLNFLKNITDEEVPELSETNVHVEYKEPSFVRRLFSWKRKEKINELQEDLTEEEMAKLEEMESEIEAIEDEESELEEMEEELEEKRQGLLASMFSKMRLFGGSAPRSDDFDEEGFDEAYEEEVPQIDEDVKEVLKITHSWIERLAPRIKKEFKASSDFDAYKGILIKYGLVREKNTENSVTGTIYNDASDFDDAPLPPEGYKPKSVENKPRKIIKKTVSKKKK